MGRSSVIRPWMLRHLLRSRPGITPLSSLRETPISSANKVSNSSLSTSRALFNFTIAPITTATFLLPEHFNLCRNFCSSSSGPSNMVVIESEEEFNSSLRKVQDESLSAIFYYTASWCGPCRLLAPILKEESEDYPHVTTYKVDIDKEGLQSILNKFSIHSVPTLHFFHDGKKADEVIGADVELLRQKMKELYHEDYE
ncbi:thioredoxin O2, mitochondrial-like isoform X2 [Cornus florida]|uniref:thioredoxin O2, mitochondrial-like isoform X2 n=1 Tax=Cornus florida TaxID=4283 RepID=UPI0028A02972|nr:thioredoxin O2, mitochondrial-like isoform X2 [Cornus florida]